MDDFSGLEYDQESVTDEDVITKTNNLLNQFNLPTQVTSISDITASLFVVLYESLFSDRLPGIIRQPVTHEDEVHNCQTVIDILSADVIRDNLSHIRGVDIVSGKVQAVSNLIDIFTFLFEYVIKQIETESDVPSDTEDDKRSTAGHLESADDSATHPSAYVTTAVEKGKSEWKKNRNGRTPSTSDKTGQPHNASNGANEVTRKADGGENAGDGNQPIATARTRSATKTRSAEGLAPVFPEMSTLAKGSDESLNSTEELIQEGEDVERQLQEKKAQPEVATAVKDQSDRRFPMGQFDFIGMRSAAAQSSHVTDHTSARSRASANAVNDSNVSGHMMVQPPSSENVSKLSATTPLLGKDSGPATANEQGKLRVTVGPIHYHSRLTPEKPYHCSQEPLTGLSSSYGDLHQMVQCTAAMTRAAIHTSPMRMHRGHSSVLDITDFSGERYQIPPSEAMKLAQDLNLAVDEKTCLNPYSVGDGLDVKKSEFLPSKVQRKVAFSHDRQGSTLDHCPEQDARFAAREKMFAEDIQKPANGQYARQKRDLAHSLPKTKYGWETRTFLPSGPPRQQQPFNYQHGQLNSDGEFMGDLEAENDSYAGRIKQSNTDDAAMARKHWTSSKKHPARLSERLQEMGKPGLADAQRYLETENLAFQRKQDFLKKMYREQYEDVADEVKSQIDTERKILKDMDDEYKKLLQTAAATASRPAAKKAKSASKPRGYLLPSGKKMKRSQPTISSKVRHRSSSAGHIPDTRERPMSLGDDDDLMPILLEEFPYLYMSEHTWHELWRHGIAQIENLTRAYEESKRKKSKAQQQVEEAARKHEILADIVKKQLEHNKRMRDIHDQKKQQAMLKNKLHEKRVQSARARRYYNEYQVRARAKMLKRRTREELIFKNLFKDGLAIQKERIRDLRRYAKEQHDKQAQKRQDDIDSLENFYRDQFEMLVERIAKDREEMLIRERAQQKVLEKIKKDLRHKMEKEIVDIQCQLFRDEDDAYFRQLDADRLRHELHLAKYQTRI